MNGDSRTKPRQRGWNGPEVRSQHRRRRAVAASAVLLSLGALGWTTMFLFEIRPGVIEHPSTIASETPVANDSPPASQVAMAKGEPSVLTFSS